MDIHEKIERVASEAWSLGIEIPVMVVSSTDMSFLLGKSTVIPAGFNVFQYHTQFGSVNIETKGSYGQIGYTGYTGYTGYVEIPYKKGLNKNKVDSLKNLLKHTKGADMT